MTKETFIEQIKASTKSIKCDLVIQNINIIDVFNKNIFIDSVGIKNGYIVGIGDYQGEITFDGTGKYMCPGLIDAHCHIESSLTSPAEYYKVALLNGITSVITDPHYSFETMLANLPMYSDLKALSSCLILLKIFHLICISCFHPVCLEQNLKIQVPYYLQKIFYLYMKMKEY